MPLRFSKVLVADERYAAAGIFDVDNNGNGINDLIVGAGHGYGLYRVEQQVDSNSQCYWNTQCIDPNNSQYHDMMWIDIDGDGQCERVTGSAIAPIAETPPARTTLMVSTTSSGTARIL